jgi:hypothetical protein
LIKDRSSTLCCEVGKLTPQQKIKMQRIIASILLQTTDKRFSPLNEEEEEKEEETCRPISLVTFSTQKKVKALKLY